MKIAELQQALADIAARGQVGSVVALRMNLQLAQANVDLHAVCATLIELASTLLGSIPERLMSQQLQRPEQWDLLVNYAGGQTLSLTAGCGAARTSRLDCLMIGNHGIARLEGGELFDTGDWSNQEQLTYWRELIDKGQLTQ